VSRASVNEITARYAGSRVFSVHDELQGSNDWPMLNRKNSEKRREVVHMLLRFSATIVRVGR